MSGHRPSGPAYDTPPGHETFLLPDLGEGLTEAEIVTWLVEDGDVITVDQIVVEVETAKAKVEVPAPHAGIVAVRHAAEGETLEVGAALLTVRDPDFDDAAGMPSADSQPEVASPAEPAPGEPTDIEAAVAADPAVDDAAVTTAGEPVDTGESGGGSGNVLIGYGTTDVSSTRRRKVGQSRETEVSAIVAPPVVVRTPPSGRHEANAESPNQRALRVTSPIVRRLARDAGLDLATVAGTGPDGLITRADVLGAIATAGYRDLDERPVKTPASAPARQAPAAASAPSAPSAPAAAKPAPASAKPAPAPAKPAPAATSAGVMSGDRHTGLPVLERRAMSAFRRTVAASLSRSRSEIPEATVWVDVDFTDLVALRASLAGQPDSPGLMAYLARFITAGLKSHPELNSTYNAENDELVMWDGVNLGIAVQSPRGLVAPAILNAHAMTTRELGVALKQLAVDARDGKSTPQELLSGTFTLNNYGMYNVDGSAAIINHPQTAIMGFGRVIDRPWVIDGQIVVRKIGQMSFVFDHRVCDGGLASSFIRFVADAIESPGSVLADL
ncbi:MAG: 2-oxo acid dehydrogenase subunit E2 [Dermatophilaceae bacterium]|nr:2-oxo acid dehydrogenase subunit E2 [Dermatophilaceae bacterium]